MRSLSFRWRTPRSALAVSLALGLAVVLVLTVVAVVRAGRDTEEAVSGVPVPADQVAVIARAGLSCPALNPARLAGQIMQASGFRPGSPGGEARLADQEWAAWAPWPGADRDDPAAGITALAHLTCDLTGQVREAGLGGDLWEPALAARHAGLEAVRAAHGVPEQAAGHVRAVAGYATWYAQRNDQLVPPSPAASTTPGTNPAAAPKPVPDELIAAVKAAGQQCPEVTPALVAAQLMAASGFRGDATGGNGAQGIAGFLPALWTRYGNPGTTPADPKAAVAALGTAMCAITASLRGITADSYAVALTAFHHGPATTGAPDDRSFARQVLAYAPYYAKDARLALPAAVSSAGPAAAAPGGGPAAPGTAPRPVAVPTTPLAATTTHGAGAAKPHAQAPAGGGTPATATTTKKAPRTTKPAPPKTAAASGSLIKSTGGGCVDVPRAADGTRLRIASCAGDPTQRWVFAGDGSLRNRGLCMDLAWASSDNGTAVQVATCNGGWAQKFTVNGAHDLVNTAIGKCVDVADGGALHLWTCTGGGSQKWSRVS